MTVSSRIAVSGLASVLLLLPVAAQSQTGTISGTVRLNGTAPAPRMIQVDKNQDVCGESIQARDVIVNGGNIAYAVAYIEGLEGETDASAEYVLSNANCVFAPPVLAATAGATLVVDNQDEVLHNTHLNLVRGERSRTVGNWALSRKGASIRADRPLRQAGEMDVECDAHGWMHGKIMVFDHPYFAVSNDAGSFEITGVPAGTHTLVVWHEVFGETRQSVTVAAGASASVSVSLSASGGGEDRP